MPMAVGSGARAVHVVQQPQLFCCLYLQALGLFQQGGEWVLALQAPAVALSLPLKAAEARQAGGGDPVWDLQWN